MRIDGDVGRLRAADGIPRHIRPRGTRDGDRAVVLLGAVQPIGKLLVHADSIDLRGRLILLRGPGCAAGERDVGAAVVAIDHLLRIERVDPQVVVIGMRRRTR